jgi:hypothetical protein
VPTEEKLNVIGPGLENSAQKSLTHLAKRLGIKFQISGLKFARFHKRNFL